MERARNKELGPDTRIHHVQLIPDSGGEDAFETLAHIIYDEDDVERVRTHAVQSLARLDTPLEKRKAYRTLLDLLTNPERALRTEAIASMYLLRDTRALFPLVNLYNRLDDGEQRRERYAIIETIGLLRDSRATDFLESLLAAGDAKTISLANEARDACAGNEHSLYTFDGDEDERLWNTARKQLMPTGIACTRIADGIAGQAREFLLPEEHNGVCYAAYAVLPDDADEPFSGECTFAIAPLRTEHVLMAQGRDVLAAGQIGIVKQSLRGTPKIAHLDNHSGGYLPGQSSFSWVAKSLARAGVQLEQKQLTTTYPAGGYFTEDFLSQQPLYAPRP